MVLVRPWLEVERKIVLISFANFLPENTEDLKRGYTVCKKQNDNAAGHRARV